MAAQPTSSNWRPIVEIKSLDSIENIIDKPYNFLQYHALKDSLLTMDDLKYLSENNITKEDVTFYKSLSKVRETFGGKYYTILGELHKNINKKEFWETIFKKINYPKSLEDIIHSLNEKKQITIFNWSHRKDSNDEPFKDVFLRSYINNTIASKLHKYKYKQEHNIMGYEIFYTMQRIDILYEETYHLLRLIYCDTYVLTSGSYMNAYFLHSPKYPLDRITAKDDLYELIFMHCSIDNMDDVKKITDMFDAPETIDYKYLKSFLYKRFDNA